MTKEDFIEYATEYFQVSDASTLILSIDEIHKIVNQYRIEFPYWLVNEPGYKVTRGMYKLALKRDTLDNALTATDDDSIDDASDADSACSTSTDDPSSMSALIPEHHVGYVKFGFHKDLSTILASKQLFPIYIAGESGFGKTLMVYECCHETRRELIRVQVSPETDKTSLLYVPELKGGNLSYELGPVAQAMELGAVLLLDEIDRGTDKLLCLNGILEGKPWYNEKTQQLIHPKPGFTVIATGNSKGQGSQNSSYLVRILDGAFLERFPITVEHRGPNEISERRIIKTKLDNLGMPEAEDFATKLATWSNYIKKTKEDGSEEIEIVSTRRLIDICEAYKIWGDRRKAIQMCLYRFPEDIYKALIQHYDMIDARSRNEKTIKEGELFIASHK